MPSFVPFRWLLMLLLGLGALPVARASHLRGGDITDAATAATTAGVPRYHLVARIFFDTSPGVAAPNTTVVLTASRAGCGAVAPNSFTVQLPIGRKDNSPLLSCTSVIPAAYYVAYYETDLDLPNGQWLLGISETSRSVSISNITVPGSSPFYFSAFLDNTLTTQDTSPRFESIIQPYLGLGAVPPHSFSAFDSEGDSLRYEALLPLAACGTSAFSTYAPQFQLNTSSGAVTQLAASSSQGLYSIVTRVSEYRRFNGSWQLLGTVMRENIYQVYATTNQAPTFTTLQVNGGASQSPNQLLRVAPGQTIALTLTATDPDAGQLLRFTTEATNVVPGLTLTPLNATQVRLTWQVPATLPLGRYHIPVAVLDNGCSVNASEDRTLSFLVTNQVLAARPATATTAPAYPAPFREQVQFPAPAGQAVTIVDALGRTVAQLASPANGQVQWQPAPTLPAGLYLARGAGGQLLARLLRE